MGVLLTVAVIVVAAGIGAAAERRWHDRAAAVARAALTASVFTLLPFVTFFNLARLHFDADVGIGIVLGYVAVGAATALAWWAGRLLDLPAPTRGALITCALIANTGYLGYPLTASLLGFDALGEAVAWDVLVGAPALLLVGFAVGAAYGDKAGESPRERVGAFFTRNPPLFAAIAGLLAPNALAPDVLVDASRVAVVALLPIGFFAVGAALAEEADVGALRIPPPLTGSTLTIIFTKLILLPALLLVIALPLIDLPSTYLLMAAMPSGLNAMIVAHAYGLDLSTAAEAITWTTALVVVIALVASLV
ncbi:MAG: AEC family transporter [Solirubrobacterales bacterium]